MGDEDKNLDRNLEKPKPFGHGPSQQRDVNHKQELPQSQQRVLDRHLSKNGHMLELDLIGMIQRPQQTEWGGVSLASPESTKNPKTTEIESLVGRGPDFCGIVERSL